MLELTGCGNLPGKGNCRKVEKLLAYQGASVSYWFFPHVQLGMDGVFVGSGIFKSGDPASRARAIVQVGNCTIARCFIRCGVLVS